MYEAMGGIDEPELLFVFIENSFELIFMFKCHVIRLQIRIRLGDGGFTHLHDRRDHNEHF